MKITVKNSFIDKRFYSPITTMLQEWTSKPYFYAVTDDDSLCNEVFFTFW